jgi:hypothetical protein
VLGASNGTVNNTLPTSVPLLVTPVEYVLPVPVTAAVLIQKGCPLALTLNV